MTDDLESANKARKWSTQAREAAPWYQHEEVGYNYRMSNIVAGVVVTGKVFELLLVGKPIIAIVGGDLPDSELGAIIKDCSAGIVYEQANDDKDRALLKQWFCTAYQEKMRFGSLSSQLNAAERDKYSYENIAHRLYEIIEKV